MRQGLLVTLQGAGEVARWMLANADGISHLFIETKKHYSQTVPMPKGQ